MVLHNAYKGKNFSRNLNLTDIFWAKYRIRKYWEKSKKSPVKYSSDRCIASEIYSIYSTNKRYFRIKFSEFRSRFRVWWYRECQYLLRGKSTRISRVRLRYCYRPQALFCRSTEFFEILITLIFLSLDRSVSLLVVEASSGVWWSDDRWSSLMNRHPTSLQQVYLS